MKIHSIFLYTLLLMASNNLLAVDTLLTRSDVIMSGGVIVRQVNDVENGSKLLIADLKFGGEYFFLKSISIGLDIDYHINGTRFKISENRNLIFGDYYTSAHLNYYTNRLYYLKAAFTFHRNPHEDRAYPDSYKEYLYSIGFGKRFFLSDHIIGNIGINISQTKMSVLDTQGDLIRSSGIKLSLCTGVHIYFKLKSNK